jgi:hypothetical protein
VRELAVFDIDGVVADVRHRLRFLDSRPKDWAGFFAAAGADVPLAEGVALAREAMASYDLVWLTGRPERLRAVTERWLTAAGLPSGPLVMRRHRDFRPARVAKLEELHRLAARQPIVMVVDDDPEVVAALSAGGYPVRLADWVPRPGALDEAQERDGRT